MRANASKSIALAALVVTIAGCGSSATHRPVTNEASEKAIFRAAGFSDLTSWPFIAKQFTARPGGDCYASTSSLGLTLSFGVGQPNYAQTVRFMRAGIQAFCPSKMSTLNEAVASVK